MTNIFRIKKYCIVTIGMALCSLITFAQEINDQEIGFDVAKMTALLKEHGVADQDIAQEITTMQEKYRNQYVRMEQLKNTILQETNSNKRTKASRNSLTVAAPEVLAQEKATLINLYNSTNGANWKNTVNGRGAWPVNDPNAVVTAWDSATNTGWYGVAVGNDGRIVDLNLRNNNLIGNLPRLDTLTELFWVTFNGNSALTGTIDSFSNLINLSSLDIWFCKFNGTLGSLTKLVNLRDLDAAGNNISGTFPADFYKLSKLENLNLQINQLEGDYSVLGQIPTLKIINLTRNNFNEIGSTDYNNKSIPVSFKNLINLNELYLNGHGLKNNIDIIGDYMPELRSLDISSNQIEGPLPLSFSNLRKLVDIDFSINKITDMSHLSNATSLKKIKGDYNAISSIPSVFNQYIYLEYFTFNYNAINGPIPVYFKNFTKLKWLHLSYNNLTGTIPDLTSQPLSSFTIDDNQFRFVDFIDQFQFQKDRMSGSFLYYPQAKIGKFEIITKNSGESVTLKMFEDGDDRSHPLDTYKWFKNGVEIVGASNKTYTIYNLKVSDGGYYDCKAYHNNTPNMSPFVLERNSGIRLEVNAVVCTPAVGTLKASSENPSVNDTISFSLETTNTGLSYKWVFYELDAIKKKDSILTEQASLKYTFPGRYKILLEVKDSKGCITTFDKFIEVKNYCAKKPIHFTFETTATDLNYTWTSTTAAGVVVNKVTNSTGHYTYTPSFAGNYIIQLVATGVTSCEILLSEQITVISCESEGPYCENHIAIVVDESGSVSPTEAAKIKKQLKKYIQQQADDNDKLKSNIYVSLIGMSDRDANFRTDHVQAEKVTNEPAVLKKFNNWIDKYGSRNGTPGVSASSDYWQSGLDVALNATLKPNIVLLITDGCQTSDVVKLRDETMSRFNNSRSTLDSSINKPHLYVIGIENGFYVDGDINGPLSRNEDPNFVQTLLAPTTESRGIPVLRTSLKYLLSYAPTDFPEGNSTNFSASDYFGHENFDFLATTENETYFSDKLKLGQYICGNPADKDHCADCLTFQPIPNKEYMLSAWVKEQSISQVQTYENAAVNVIFYSDVIAEDLYRIATLRLTASGDIIDGWQRITKFFLIPVGTKTIGIELENKSAGLPAFFDDIRIHPLDGSVKTFVYDPETFKLMSELDENNYATFYEYDNEGGLVRVKKETAKGIKTIQETRSGNVINTTN
jgi:Leucine-rich repeat (LRR) protein